MTIPDALGCTSPLGKSPSYGDNESLSFIGQVYFPSWMEIVVTITLVSFGVIAFGLAAMYLPVFPEEH